MLKEYKKLYSAIVIFLVVIVSAPALAATVTLSSGREVDLNVLQVELLKEKQGIFFFRYPPGRIISGKLKHWDFIELPEELGAGFVIGKQERMAAALNAVEAEKSTGAEDNFKKAGSSVIRTTRGPMFEEEIAIGPKLHLTLGAEKWEGDTTYQIGGTVRTPGATYEYHFPISELEFPLDVYMISLSGSVEITKELFMSAGVKKSVTDDAGKMKDSDWITSSNPNQLDIYSESDAELDALIIDINLRYRFFEKSGLSFNAGIGYLHQKFGYDIYDLDQWYPSGVHGTGHDYVSGKVLTYEVKYSIPYTEIGAQFKIKDFSVETTLGYSPLVNAKDEDHHILRSKVNKGDCDGDAIFFSLKGQYDFLNNWFLTLGLGYTKIETEGESKAYFYGIYDHTIDEEIFSEQKVVAFTMGYVF